MDILKIDQDQKGYFIKNGEWVPIRDIERDDLLSLISAVADHEDIHMDECSDSIEIKNPIAKTIYQQVYNVLNDLNENRSIYLDEIDREFDELERKYELV